MLHAYILFRVPYYSQHNLIFPQTTDHGSLPKILWKIPELFTHTVAYPSSFNANYNFCNEALPHITFIFCILRA